MSKPKDFAGSFEQRSWAYAANRAAGLKYRISMLEARIAVLAKREYSDVSAKRLLEMSRKELEDLYNQYPQLKKGLS